MKGKSHEQKDVGSLTEPDNIADLNAHRFAFSFESFWKLSEKDRRRWLALSQQIEEDPMQKEKVLDLVKERYMPKMRVRAKDLTS